MTPAEKQRRSREKRDKDPVKRQQYLQYEKQKYIADKGQGKKKLVADMTKREHRATGMQWRKKKKDIHLKKKSNSAGDKTCDVQGWPKPRTCGHRPYDFKPDCRILTPHGPYGRRIFCGHYKPQIMNCFSRPYDLKLGRRMFLPPGHPW